MDRSESFLSMDEYEQNPKNMVLYIQMSLTGINPNDYSEAG